MKCILCVGYQKAYINEIIRILRSDEQLLILEEESLVKDDLLKSGLQYFTGEYQQSQGAVDVIREVRNNYDIRAVVPLREYAVPTAFRIAQSLELGGVGEVASVCLRDKYLLREELSQRNPKHFVQPCYKRINGLSELEDFYQKFGPCVIKPSAKQSTVGVFVIREQAEIRELYEASISSDEPGRVANDRLLTWEYHAETFLSGIEYSTELFVQEGMVKFFNGTRKKTHDGPCPFEIGHALPLSIIDHLADEKLKSAAYEFVELLEVKNAVIHAEWIVSESGEVGLVEAAARVPGCFITDLIGNTYGFNFFRVWLDLLSGKKDLVVSNTPKQISAMRWLSPEDGIVSSIRELDSMDFSNDLNVLRSSVTVKPGDSISLKNNQTRIGYLIAEMIDSESITELDCLSDKIVKVRVT